jgi:hypothetical protein
MRGVVAGLVGLAVVGVTGVASAQDPGTVVPPASKKMGGSKSVELLAHVTTHAGPWMAADLEMEQDPNRPYVYICGFVNQDMQIWDVRDVRHPKKIYDWTIEHPELHNGMAMDGKYFQIGNRYYYAQSYQFFQGSPDADLGAVIFDVTGLPDTSTVKVVARIRYPESPMGFHNTFAYKHSDGRVLYFATTQQPQALIYDLGKVVSGADPSTWLIGKVPNPTPFKQIMGGGYHDFEIQYDPATHQDKFYGAGLGGYSAWDVTHPETPKELFTITGLGYDIAHTFTPSPDGHYAVTETEYQYTPLRIWDLSAAQEGKTHNLDLPISGWTADWRDLSHNHEVRWPYVFVSGYEDGLQIFDLKDPLKPKTDGYYYTCEIPEHLAQQLEQGQQVASAAGDPPKDEGKMVPCVHERGFGGGPQVGWQSKTSVEQGAFGIDVRNRDGLIVISDMRSGLWLFHLKGFDGWNGHTYGMPNISSVQDYVHGPEGAPPVGAVSSTGR